MVRTNERYGFKYFISHWWVREKIRLHTKAILYFKKRLHTNREILLELQNREYE